MRMVAEGDRNMYVCSINNVCNSRVHLLFLYKACLNARYGTQNVVYFDQGVRFVPCVLARTVQLSEFRVSTGVP